MTITRRLRAAVVALTAATLLGLTAHTAAAQPPTFDFSDCPAIPPGADPAQWRCEVLVSTGTVRFGNLAEQQLGTMRLTFAEGQLNGKFAQVFGSLRADPVPVPGGLLGVPGAGLPRMEIQLRYAGFADFESDGDRMGVQHLKIGVRSPLLPKNCTVGSDEDPLVFRPIRTAGTEVISTDPLVLRFAIADNAFAVPGLHGCGRFSHLLSHRLGVPAPAGTNTMTLTTYVGLRDYV
jgi:hypothetical protein